MALKATLLLLTISLQLYDFCDAQCQIEGVSNWLTPLEEKVNDTHLGIFFERNTNNIVGITNIVHRDGLNRGPYLDISLLDSQLRIATNNAFVEYEEYETSHSIGVTITFNCIGSSTTGVLVVVIDITDTNNNAPRFLPTNNYEFTVIPPLPPGYLVTGCENQITVRDIDLTTQRIDFTIEDNSDFEIFYDTSSSTPKEFQAIIRTKSFLRSIPEPINITITATDVDETNDPPLTETATIYILPNEQFVLPDELIFSNTFYIFNYTDTQTLETEEIMYLVQGFDNEVIFDLDGLYSDYFELIYLNDNEMTLEVKVPLTSQILNERQIFLVLRGEREHTSGSSATVIIQFPKARKLGFSSLLYKGLIENITIQHETIILYEGYTDNVVFDLKGEYADLFNVSNNFNQVLINVKAEAFEDVMNSNNVISVTVTAHGINVLSTFTTVVFEIIKNDKITPVFSKNIYEGAYVNASHIDIEYINLIQGLADDVYFRLNGDFVEYFRFDFKESDIILSLESGIPEDIIYSEKVFVLYITAVKEATVGGNAAIVIRFPDDIIEPRLLSFTKYTYKGTLELENRSLFVEDIVLEIGFTDDVKFEMIGDYSNYFRVAISENIISIAATDQLFDQDFENEKLLILNVRAETERALSVASTIVIDLITRTLIQPVFSKAYYIGRFSKQTGLEFDDVIILEVGFDETVTFVLEGDSSQWFYIVGQNENSGIILKNETHLIPTEILSNNNQLMFSIVASKPGTIPGRAAISIELIRDSSTELEVAFDKVLYKGQLVNGVVFHEPITVLRYSGDITLSGEYEEFFRATVANGNVSVQFNLTFFPSELQYVVLKLSALEATSVLLLDVVELDQVPPSLLFSSSNYSIQIEESQTGLIGRVTATADNGEAVIYALELAHEHLRQRLSINTNGEIHASAPTDVGSYIFRILASTTFTGVSAYATVYLTVVNATSCDSDDIILLPPLLIIERYEEEPHLNLVPLDRNKYPNCNYQLTNVWPIDQNWMYVDDNGLHTISIDREHEAIAFMHISQVQVELNLYCDDETRSKRSLSPDVRYDQRSYDDGQNHWIVTDNIPYNPRRTLVNLIVLDINDNAPIFEDKENEPIIVGYPERNIEEIVLPRALVELKATDADIGENAKLLYWSSEQNIVVSPSAGSVHVRNYASLEDDSRLIVNATDRNGNGLTGSIEILVKLLDTNHLAVITVRNAFIGDEKQILDDLSRAVGYEVKTLRSTVISERTENDANTISQTKRQADTGAASLRLYVYGLRYQTPVEVTQLTTDLNSNIVTVSLAQVLSLEDHLEGIQRCPVAERAIGLLVATIVLAGSLFIIIVTVAIWFALKWKNKPSYEQFSDLNSLASRNGSIETPKPDNVLPRIDIDELRKSEKKLQDILDSPAEEINKPIIEPTIVNREPSSNSVTFAIPNETTPSSSVAFESSNDSNMSNHGDYEIPKPTISSNNVTFEIPDNTLSANSINYDLPNETIVSISASDPNGAIVIQSFDKLKDNTDESEDDDEFGERQRARRKSVVTFNESVEKIIHLEDRTDEESDPDIEIYKF